MVVASGEKGWWRLATLLALGLALLGGAARAESDSAAAWAFDLMAQVQQQQSAGPLDFLLPSTVNEQPILATTQTRLQANYVHSPMHFEPNLGQTAGAVQFMARGPGYTLFLTSDEAVLALRPTSPRSDRLHRHPLKLSESTLVQIPTEKPVGPVVRMRWEGPNRNCQPVLDGRNLLPGISNYFLGNDQTKWRTSIPHYRQVQYQGVYPGIDLVFYGNPRQLEYDFVLAPDANSNDIRLAFDGIEGMRVADNGDLILQVMGGELVQKAPKIYQEVNGEQREIAGRYVLWTGEHEQVAFTPTTETPEVLIGFQVASYQPNHILVIDPVLVYSTYLGGSSYELGENGIAVDSAGNAYVTGYTESTDFPTANSFQSVSRGRQEAFVTKFNRAGNGLIYSTYLGGSSSDYGESVAVDDAGNSYIGGFTYSYNFPIINSLQNINAGGPVGFITKLNPAGNNLIYSTYLGGTGGDSISSIALDNTGSVYVTGFTHSTDFPTTADAFQVDNQGDRDAFVAKINPQGSALVYSTYLGGSSIWGDFGRAIAVDSAGNAYVTGETKSDDFPTTPNAFQTIGGEYGGIFVTKLNSTGTDLVYSTYFNESSAESGFGIAVDSSGSAYVTGGANSNDFPTTPNAFQESIQGGCCKSDAFITKFNPAGSALVYSTFLGGSEDETAKRIAVDSAGNAYIIGFTGSSDFPIVDGFQNSLRGSGDIFIAKLNPVGSDLVYSTYLGSSGGWADGIAVDDSGAAYVVGTTSSTDFPMVNAFQSSKGGGYDIFVAKISGSAYQLKVTKTGNGTITSDPSGIDCGTSCDSAFAIGATVTLTATPATGYSFSNWNGDACTGTTNSTCLITLNSDKNVTALFKQNSYTVTATAGPNGTISPSSRTVNYGATTTFTVTPNTSYTASVTGCNGSLSGSTYTTGLITSGCTVTATFNTTTPNTYALTVSKAGTGSGTVTGAGNYAAGATVTLTATPNTGSIFAGWSPSPCAASFAMPANNLTCQGTFNAVTVASSPSLVLNGDYNGDGKADLLWRNSTTGEVYGMLLDGTFVSQQGGVYQEPNTAWQIIHNGDFDGNGKDDLLWWNNQTGQVYLMLMNGLSMADGAMVYQEPNTAWQIVAVGDLNGDGQADLLWWNHQTGQVYGMLMNGAARIQEALIYQEPNTGWRILAARDFTGDQKADLLWRNTTTGQVYLMSMNGLSIADGAMIHQEPNLAWSIVAVGDLSGDGKADLVWRNSQTGQVYGMLMNGSVISTQGVMYTEPNTAWQIVGSGDYNGDGRTDLLWRNSATGQTYQMLMNGLSVVGGAVIYQEANPDWGIAANVKE